jgi:hypothetical protein
MEQYEEERGRNALLKSQPLLRAEKIKIYKTLIRAATTCSSRILDIA